MTQQVVTLKVGMSCQGCVGAIKRVLGKLDGVQSVEVDLEQQKVVVTGDVDPETVFQKVAKIGKPTSYWN